MEKEKKVNVNEEVKEVASAEITEVKEIAVASKLFLQRQTFTGNDGKEYWSYILKGKIRNRDVKVDFAPKDKGGYEVLDIVFEFSNEKVELIMLEETMTDSITRQKRKYMTYKAQGFDESGNVYECGIKPAHDSDKALLTMIINQMGVQNRN